MPCDRPKQCQCRHADIEARAGASLQSLWDYFLLLLSFVVFFADSIHVGVYVVRICMPEEHRGDTSYAMGDSRLMMKLFRGRRTAVKWVVTMPSADEKVPVPPLAFFAGQKS